LNKISIDRLNPTPYYAQVKDVLRDWIRQGKWKPGDQLPGEYELCETFHVSRTVVRQALTELTTEGFIRREKGKGTFVAERKIKEALVQRLTGFYQDMSAQGLTPLNKILVQERVEADATIANFLSLPQGTPLIKIERLRFIENEPMVLVTTYIPYQLCPQLLHDDLTQQSLYMLLEKQYGVIIAFGRRLLEAVPASKYEAGLLKIRKGAPLILLDSVSYDPQGNPVEYYRALHRGDRSQFEVELVRVRDEAGIYDVLSSEIVAPPITIKPSRGASAPTGRNEDHS